MSPGEPEGAASSARFGVLLKVAYDGTAFAGWAPQRDGRTVHDALFGAIRALDPKATPPRGTSRTDAGVHAEGQLAAFDATLAIPPRGWVLAINQHLPDDVAVRQARAVPVDFNPRFASKVKRYTYRLLLDRVRDPLVRDRGWRIGWPLDLDAMGREARSFEGTHDFAAFRSAHDARAQTTRTMNAVTIRQMADDPRVIAITIEGTAFLYNMVRIMVGTLVDVARGKLKEGAVLRALASKQRRDAGETAPPHGLTLEAIDLGLDEDGSEPWPR